MKTRILALIALAALASCDTVKTTAPDGTVTETKTVNPVVGTIASGAFAYANNRGPFTATK